MEFEQKIINWIVGFFLLAGIQGIIAYAALLLNCGTIVRLIYYLGNF